MKILVDKALSEKFENFGFLGITDLVT